MANEVLMPEVTFNLTSADIEVENSPQRVLLVGQMLSGGIATAGAIVENITSDGIENSLFQRDSQLAEMVRMFKSIAPGVRLDAIPLDDAAGTPAEYDITIVGTATENGTLKVIAGSAKRNTYDVPVTSGENETTIAARIAVVLNDDPNITFTVSSLAGVATLQYNHAGTTGNNLPVGVELVGGFKGSIAGITSVVVSVGANGATDPTLTGVFDTVGETRYQGVVWPYPETTDELVTFLDDRFNVDNSVLDGVGFTHKVGTFVSSYNSADALNSKSIVYLCDERTTNSAYYGGSMQEPGYLVSTAVAAIRALRLTDGASISRYVTTNSSRDQFGGAALASLPYFNTLAPQLSVNNPLSGFFSTELADLLAVGGAYVGVDANNQNAIFGPMPTTYKTDGAGNADPSWKYLNYVDTMSAVREYFFNNAKARFNQTRLTLGAVFRSRAIVNKAWIEAYLDQLYGDLSGPDYVLLASGDDALQFFKANRNVSVDLATGTATISMKVPVVTQMRVLVGSIQIAFSIEEAA